MQKDLNQSRTCTGKVGHPDYTSAYIALKKMRDLSLDVYKCTYCQKWHIGYSETSRRRDVVFELRAMRVAAKHKVNTAKAVIKNLTRQLEKAESQKLRNTIEKQQAILKEWEPILEDTIRRLREE